MQTDDNCFSLICYSSFNMSTEENELLNLVFQKIQRKKLLYHFSNQGKR